MSEPAAVDRLDVLVLVDNATDSLSTTPKNVIPEWAGLHAAGRLPEVSGAAICCAHHGLSLLMTAHIGDETHTVLFDAGPQGATLMRNAAILVVDVKGKGPFVFSGCSHAGIVNVLTHARDVFPAAPLYGVMGGFHLAGVTEKIIPDTIRDVKRFRPALLAPGHCTGWRAISLM